MTPIELIRDELRRSLHGAAWHGPALLEALDDVSPDEAVARPLPGAHSIAELALHALAWIEEVTRRVAGAENDEPARGDWPAVPEPLDSPVWTGIKGDLAGAGAALDSLLATLPPARLDELARRAGGELPPDPIDYATTLHGLAQHNAYHGGQIAMLKRALRHPA